MAGLAVAIPALFGYNYILSRVKDATADMHVFIDEFVTKMAEFYPARRTRSPQQRARQREPDGAPQNFDRSHSREHTRLANSAMQVQDDKPYDDINITPMLDLAYVLLVIFILMCTASVQGIKVNLPKASAAPSLAKPKTKAITINNQGGLALDTDAGEHPGAGAAATASQGGEPGDAGGHPRRQPHPISSRHGRARRARSGRSVASRPGDQIRQELILPPCPFMMKFLVSAGLLASLCAGASAAAEQSPAELKLRETLRNTMLQLRNLQGEKDTLQAQKDQTDLEKKEVESTLEKKTKDSDAALAEAKKEITDLQAKLEAQKSESERLSISLEKWKVSHQQVTELATKREAARAKLNTEKIELDRKVADQTRKNQQMYKIGNEVLTRYENFGLGTALTAREPFVGITKVKLQNLVQDYGDKLAEQRIKPDAKSAAAAPAPANR